MAWEAAETRTGADGRFSLGRLGSGAHELEAAAPGFASRELLASAGTETRIALEGGAVLAGVVQRADGSPAPGALIRVEGIEAQADAEGRLRVEGIPPGICRVRARASHHDDAPDTEYDLEFLTDERRLHYVITIDRARTSYLEVHLVDHAGDPLTDWTLYDPWHEITAGKAGAGGRFRLEFEGAPGEDMLLTATPPEESDLLHFQNYARTDARPDGDPIEMRVPRLVRVTFVGRGPGGALLAPRIELRVGCWGPSREIPRGRKEPVHQVTMLVRVGEEYSLDARAKGYIRKSEEWVPPPGGRTVELILQPLGGIRGLLLAPDKTPVRRAHRVRHRSACIPATRDTHGRERRLLHPDPLLREGRDQGSGQRPRDRDPRSRRAHSGHGDAPSRRDGRGLRRDRPEDRAADLRPARRTDTAERRGALALRRAAGLAVRHPSVPVG